MVLIKSVKLIDSLLSKLDLILSYNSLWLIAPFFLLLFMSTHLSWFLHLLVFGLLFNYLLMIVMWNYFSMKLLWIIECNYFISLIVFYSFSFFIDLYSPFAIVFSFFLSICLSIFLSIFGIISFLFLIIFFYFFFLSFHSSICLSIGLVSSVGRASAF